MKRRFITVFSAVTVLAFFAIVLLWIRALVLSPQYILYLHLPSSRIRMDIEPNRTSVARFSAVPTDRSLPTLTFYDTYPVNKEPDGGYGDLYGWAPNPHSLLGFGFSVGIPTVSRGVGQPDYTFVCTVPSWFLVLAAGLPLIVPARRVWRIRRREKRLLCPSCGYDIRASSDRCPECGMCITTPGDQNEE
jgi:hypothetical protein